MGWIFRKTEFGQEYRMKDIGGMEVWSNFVNDIESKVDSLGIIIPWTQIRKCPHCKDAIGDPLWVTGYKMDQNVWKWTHKCGALLVYIGSKSEMTA